MEVLVLWLIALWLGVISWRLGDIEKAILSLKPPPNDKKIIQP